RGSAVNQDGASSGLTAPNGPAQQAVIREALARAGVGPEGVAYVECHGTGTALGDPIEVQSLGAAYGRGRGADARLAIGSVKTNVGHLEAAAGIAGLIKTALAVRHGEVPPSLHFQSLNPKISLDGTSLFIPTAPVPWPAAGPRCAGVSSFGWSGTNAHIVLSEPPAVEEAPVHEGPWAVPLSGRSAEALRELARRYAEAVQGQDAPGIEAFAYTAGARKTHHEHRGVAVGRTAEELAQRLRALAEGETTQVDATRKLAFVFPGQGGQWPGMALDLARREKVLAEALERCERALDGFLEAPLLDVLGGEELGEGGRIEVVQPALFAVQVALAELWRSLGVEPEAVIGHSMGEVAAACVAGALSLEDGARVIGLRSRLMSRLRGRGAMAVVELPLAQAREEAVRAGGRVAVAASNGPRSTVLSGEREALGELLDDLGRRDVFCRWIKVDMASHSPQVEELRDELLEGLKHLRPRRGTVPFYSTVLGERISGEECGPEYWVRNLR
ncbi:MAG TPA: type I polyketide synthase, partial [Anaeromyxobacteraceae bacterium]